MTVLILSNWKNLSTLFYFILSYSTVHIWIMHVFYFVSFNSLCCSVNHNNEDLIWFLSYMPFLRIKIPQMLQPFLQLLGKSLLLLMTSGFPFLNLFQINNTLFDPAWVLFRYFGLQFPWAPSLSLSCTDPHTLTQAAKSFVYPVRQTFVLFFKKLFYEFCIKHVFHGVAGRQ